MYSIRFFFIIVGMLLGFLSVGEAKPIPKQNFLKDLPIEIEAQNGITCDRDHKICEAKNAKVHHGAMTLEADLLKITFDEEEGVQIVYAQGHVKLSDGNQYQAEGGEGSFDTRTGIAILQRSALARDTKENRILQGRKIVLKIVEKKQGSQGSTDVESINVYGDVHIKTPREVATSKEATYEGGKNFVTLDGDVRITNQDGQISGDRATLNLNTGESQMKSKDGPVKVLLNRSKSPRLGLGSLKKRKGET